MKLQRLDDPVLRQFNAAELRTTAEFLTNCLPFLSKGLCNGCIRTLSDRIRSLDHISNDYDEQSNQEENVSVATTNNKDATEYSGSQGNYDTNSLGSWNVDDTEDTNSLGSWKDGGNGWSEQAAEVPTSEAAGLPVAPVKSPRVRKSWADMALEEELAEQETEGSRQLDGEDSSRPLDDDNVMLDEAIEDVKVSPKAELSRDQREYIRFTNVKRKKDYIVLERVNGRLVNILDGLELHSGVFSAAEQKRIVDFVYELQEMGKKGQLKAETPPTTDWKVKILSYNVWFREDLEMVNRMKAIGDLIRLHSPDVICFQEVTPDIYGLFQQSNWWKSYKCSLSNEMAVTRAYFCMQLSKLPVKSFSRKPFSYSAMGRELCVSEVAPQVDIPLVVATSHLESPCPGPPKWDQMYSKERVNQAKEAVNFLKQYRNVIFCGDMNWDDKLDGQFPLPDGWIDVWTKLRPEEDGWTYDTKSNQMLSGNRKLQKRLDRFLCNLHDFKLNGIEMIGMKAIPELSYLKEKKGGKSLELPVLPSDHYGLLLTICAP